jgi:methyl-accepting chemotaxis protein
MVVLVLFFPTLLKGFKMAIRYKLGLIVAGLSFIIFSMFLITWYTTSAQKTDGLLINLSGRQRMLSQKMSKEIVLFVSATDAKEKETLKTSATRSMEVFDITLSALIESGEVPLSLDPSGAKAMCPKSPEPAASQLVTVRTQWKEFAGHMKQAFAENKDVAGI